MTPRKPRFTYANIVSSIALLASLTTGSAYAVEQITAAQIKTDAIRARHIKQNAVGAGEVASGSIDYQELHPRVRYCLIYGDSYC
jgi:hypothetical protein